MRTLGEFGLIRRIQAQFKAGVPTGVIGIGDDCAVIPKNRSTCTLITTDLLIEGVHFRQEWISPRELGYKSLAVSLSDVAAMGGIPRFAFLSLALPRQTRLSWVEDFFTGFRLLARKTGVALVGGDTSRSQKGIFINVALIGEAKTSRVKFRSTAQAGDIICVTSSLGDSAAGLKLLECDHRSLKYNRLIKAHLKPRPHLAEGQWLAKQHAVHAMMDVSDGIDSDLRQIMRASRVGAEVSVDSLPLSKTLLEACARFGWDPLELALAGGEDYCLLCTVSLSTFEVIAAKFLRHFGRPFFPVGKITATQNRLDYRKNGQPALPCQAAHDHFN